VAKSLDPVDRLFTGDDAEDPKKFPKNFITLVLPVK
jgi:hypothetical protein